jgi:hypothetical protein
MTTPIEMMRAALDEAQTAGERSEQIRKDAALNLARTFALCSIAEALERRM